MAAAVRCLSRGKARRCVGWGKGPVARSLLLYRVQARLLRASLPWGLGKLPALSRLKVLEGRCYGKATFSAASLPVEPSTVGVEWEENVHRHPSGHLQRPRQGRGSVSETGGVQGEKGVGYAKWVLIRKRFCICTCVAHNCKLERLQNACWCVQGTTSCGWFQFLNFRRRCLIWVSSCPLVANSGILLGSSSSSAF